MAISARIEGSLYTHGNWGRLKKVMRRAQAGEHLVIGYLGGSITQGSLSSTPESCYASLSFSWWPARFPQSTFTFVNAGIGGTTSHFGVARVQEDLLSYAPDVVFVEFSVNDDNDNHFRETYESLIRRILNAPTAPAVVLLHNSFYTDGKTAQEVHLQVGRHYDLPSLSFKHAVQSLTIDGSVALEELTPDGLHPNDAGHRLLADTVIAFLEQVYEKKDEEEAKEREVFFFSPLTANRFARATRLRNTDIEPIDCEGFTADASPQEHITQTFKKGWMAMEKGSEITFEVQASCIALQYRKTIQHPAPKAIVFIDGMEENAIVLDADFDEDWGDALFLQDVIEGSIRTRHEVTVRIVETSPEDKLPFYLVSLLVS